MNIIHAIYENGVFRPIEAVDLPEKAQVTLEVRTLSGSGKTEHLDEIYEILSRSYDGGERDIAARHNEHQP